MSPERLCSDSGETKGLLRYVGGDSRTPLGHSVSPSESLRVICGLIAAWGPVQRRNSGFKKPSIDNRLPSFFHISNYL